MQSNQDGPTLTLSDIMHTPSPSPGPQPPTQMQTDQSPVDSQVVSQQSSSQSFYVHSISSAPLADPSDSETISSAELHSIRSRLSELSLAHVDSSQNEGQNDREKEIIALALRLTSFTPVYPDPQQLASQAETIAGLIKQRDLFLEERDEDLKRWQAEREGWDRMAEALIGKRRAAIRAGIDDETHRQMQKLSDDNKALKDKLFEAQRRLLTLEAELNQLRPLLLMQSVSAPNIAFSLPPQPSRRKLRSHKDGEAAQPTDDTPSSQSVTQIPSGALLGPLDFQGHDIWNPHHPAHYRGTHAESSQSSARKSKRVIKPAPSSIASPPTRTAGPILSDARSECLLLAARKFGRLKAGMVAGIVKEVDQEKEKTVPTKTRGRGKDKREKTKLSESSLPQTPGTDQQPVAGPSVIQGPFYTHPPPVPPRTPRRSASTNTHPPVQAQPLPAHLHPSMAHSHAHPGNIVYINPATLQSGGGVPLQMQMRASGGVPVLVPIPPGVWQMPTTPAPLRRRSSKSRARATPGPSNHPQTDTENDSRGVNPTDRDHEPQTPATPLDSLLNAARTLMIDEDYDGDGGHEGHHTSEAAMNPRPSTSTNKRRRRRAPNPVEAPESPVPKRRRTVLSLAPAPVIGTPERPAALPQGSGTPLQARVRSALDVLADQAAQEHERRPSVDPGSQRVTPEESNTEPVSNGKEIGRARTKAAPRSKPATSRAKGKGRANVVSALHPSEALVRSSSMEPVLLSRQLDRTISGEDSIGDRGSLPAHRASSVSSRSDTAGVGMPKERPPDGTPSVEPESNLRDSLKDVGHDRAGSLEGSHNSRDASTEPRLPP